MIINGKKVGAVILAAGKGTRLGCTDCPKVMMEIGGGPIVSYIIDTLLEIGFEKENIVLVVGFKKEKVENYFGDRITYAHQVEQNGTAHAALTGMKELPTDIEHVLVLGGDDSAFYTSKTLFDFIDKHIRANVVLSLLTAEPDEPGNLGRVVRHTDGKVEVIEKEYTTDEQKKIREISTGTFCYDRNWFEEMYKTMPIMRKLGEYTLPTTVAMAHNNNLPHQFVKMENSNEWFGVNTPEELEEANARKSVSGQAVSLPLLGGVGGGLPQAE
ncbi:MAG: NTP transferase domain-containing protein [bacterium]|nr:NTP transferase domain-containing protein [bacterium]